MPVRIPVDRRIFSKVRHWVFIVAAVSLALVATFLFEKVKNTWPIGPFAIDHPIANTFGEIVGFTEGSVNWTWRQHFGVDILATPCVNPECTDWSSYAVATAGGTCEWPLVPNASNNVVYIEAADGHKYEYMHLDYGSTEKYMNAYTDDNTGKCTINAKDKIGGIHDAYPLDYDHLHYGITHSTYDSNNVRISTTNKNPLRMITPNPDFNRPVISGVYLVDHDLPRWTEFPSGTSDDCATVQAVVSGKANILVEVADRDDAGSPLPAAIHVGVYDLKWRACPSGNPNCAWNDTHAYETMPNVWSGNNNPTLDKRFSWTLPCITESENWIDDSSGGPGKSPRSCMIIGKSKGVTNWDTSLLMDGNYVLSVKATDMAGLEAVRPLNVCVENGRN